MKLIRTLFAVCALALLAMPAAASAQGGPGDNLSDAIPVSPGPLELTPSVRGLTVDTTNYTVEAGEFNQCGNSVYGKTVWGAFGVNRTGRIDITAAGYDAVIGLARLTNTGIEGGPCTDRLAGKIESYPRDNLPTVQKGEVYALQVGGFQAPDGSIAGGPVEVAVELLPPERVQGDAILTWRSARGGIRVTSIKVDGPRGSAAGISCLRKRCGRNQVIENPKLKGAFANPIAKVSPGAKSSSGPKLKPVSRAKEPTIRSAATAFRGRTVKNGARLLVVVLATDQIGQAFYWDVRKNAAGTKTLGCVEPGSTRIQRQGTCDGA
jgi:hypothetical protein